jgi:hypothetical protein
MLAKAKSLNYYQYVLLKKKNLSRKWKREYYRFIDGVVRSHGIQKFFMRLLYLICFVATVILAALLYVNS